MNSDSLEEKWFLNFGEIRSREQAREIASLEIKPGVEMSSDI